MNSSVSFRLADYKDRNPIVAMLQAEKLPVDDLPEDLSQFIVASAGNEIVGAVGLEQYGNAGLLRSLVVNPAYRNQGIADLLINNLEQESLTSGIESIYLLTETAPEYFLRKGFQHVARASVPQALQQSSEFSHVCPASAAVMKKSLQQ